MWNSGKSDSGVRPFPVTPVMALHAWAGGLSGTEEAWDLPVPHGQEGRPLSRPPEALSLPCRAGHAPETSFLPLS